MKYHRGINQCHIASDKIIEVRSKERKVRSNGMKVRCNGRKVRSNGMEVRSNGRKVRSNGMEVRSNGRKVRSNGTRIRSNGMQVAIRLHFCPECPSIDKSQEQILDGATFGRNHQISCCCCFFLPADGVTSMDQTDIVATQRIKKLISELKQCVYMEASALTGENVDRVFNTG